MRRLSGRWSEEGRPCRRDRPEEMREMTWRHTYIIHTHDLHYTEVVAPSMHYVTPSNKEN